MRKGSWIAAAVVVLLLPLAALGQALTTGRISGRIVAEGGSPLAGVTVTVTSAERNFEREATTDSDGHYTFALLPPGDYTLAAAVAGYQAAVLRVPVRIGETVPLDVELVAGGEVISDEMTVVGTASVLETTNTGDSFDYDTLINNLPVTDRTLESVALLSPGIFDGPTSGTLSISGAPSFDTTVLLDGAEVSDPYFGSAPIIYLEDALDEVQVLTSGVSARYGRFQGGVVNAVTKSGTNEYEGTFRLQLENEDWNSTTPFGEEQEDDLSKSYQGVLGGPILQDRAWFFVGGRTIPETSSALTAFNGETVVSTTNQDRWQVKLNGALSSSHMFEVSHLEYEQETLNDDGLPLGEAIAAGTRSDPRTLDSISYQGVLTDSTFLELQGTRKDVAIAIGGDPNGRSPFLDLANFTVYNNSWWDFTDPSVRDNETLSGTLTQFFDGGRLGLHGVEAGVQYVKSTTGGDNRQSVTNFNLLALNPDFYAGDVGGTSRYNLLSEGAVRWEALTLGGDQSLENLAVYLHDTITLGRWRFDLGARWEKYEGAGPIAPLSLDFSELVPRLGVTYELSSNWQLQATYGRYISRLNDNVGNDLTGVGAAPRIESFYLGPTLLNASAAEVEAALRNDANWLLINLIGDPNQPTGYPATDLIAPYSDDISLSVRHGFANNRGSAVLSYVDREYSALLDSFSGRVCSDYGLDFERPCPAGDITEVTIGGDEFLLDTEVWANNPDATRDYQALVLTGDYHVTPRWMVGGNYTYSRLRGNYEGEASNQPASGSGMGDWERAQYPDGNDSGPLFADIPHRLNLWSTYNLDFGSRGRLVVGNLLQLRSGQAWDKVVNLTVQSTPVYVSEDGQSYNHFFERGAGRFDDVWSLDGSLRYELPLWPHLAPWVMLSVKNLFDNDGLIAHSTVGDVLRDGDDEIVLDAAGRPTWIAVGNCGPGDEPSTECSGFGRIRDENDYQLPRELQLSVGLRF
jgi:hypothetical protein